MQMQIEYAKRGFWGVQGGASSTLVEAPEAPDLERTRGQSEHDDARTTTPAVQGGASSTLPEAPDRPQAHQGKKGRN